MVRTFAPYPDDPDAVQARLDGARQLARRWRATAQNLRLALFGLHHAAEQCPCPDARQELVELGQVLQQRHQAALYRAELCEEAEAELEPQLAFVVDLNLPDEDERLFSHGRAA